ncbi:MAG: class I SAM-dependent methyltransferase [Balneolales bacterium]
MLNSNPIYRKLAPIYDDIMQDVDYDDWTDYIHSLIKYHHPGGITMLELACGTGTMALKMEQLDHYNITATDASPDMICIAQKKGERQDSKIRWLVQDMCHLTLDHRFDIIYLVFDSLNYLHKKNKILALFDSVHKLMNPGGIFLFDFTTPNYSPKIAELLNQVRSINRRIHYKRTSCYDSEKYLHTNHFFVKEYDPDSGRMVDQFEEIHLQKIWSFREIRNILQDSELRITASYEDFDLSEANNNSDRITMVLTHG